MYQALISASMEEVFLIFNRIFIYVYSHQCTCTQKAALENFVKQFIVML